MAEPSSALLASANLGAYELVFVYQVGSEETQNFSFDQQITAIFEKVVLLKSDSEEQVSSYVDALKIAYSQHKKEFPDSQAFLKKLREVASAVLTKKRGLSNPDPQMLRNVHACCLGVQESIEGDGCCTCCDGCCMNNSNPMSCLIL